jgi:hypothetical protein
VNTKFLDLYDRDNKTNTLLNSTRTTVTTNSQNIATLQTQVQELTWQLGNATALVASLNATVNTFNRQRTFTVTLSAGDPPLFTVTNSFIKAYPLSVVACEPYSAIAGRNVYISAQATGTFTVQSDNNGDNNVIVGCVVSNAP